MNNIFNSVKNISSRKVLLRYTLGFLFLVFLISAGLYIIDNRNQVLQQAINNQFSVNSIMKALTDISKYRGKTMLLILDERDPFSRDDLIQEYNRHTRAFLKHRETLNQLNLSKVQMDIFRDAMKIIGKIYIYQTETISLINADNVVQAKKVFAEKILPEKKGIRNSYNDLIISMQNQAKLEINEAQRMSRITMTIIVVLLSLVFFLSIWIQFLAFRTTRRYNTLLLNNNEKLELIVKERTKELKLAKDEAEKSNAAKSKFLSGMSHELRTPMNAILGYGQLLQFDSDTFNETQSDNIKSILDAGNHLMTLISELLYLSKIESGKVDVNIQTILLNDVVEQCIALITPQAEAHQVKIINHIGSENYIVQVDITRIKQVLLNLLSNAVKYGNDSSQVTIDYKIVTSRYLRIGITDLGNGLSKEDIDKLFMSFERLNQKEDVEGTGLGLVITKSLIEHMGGSIGIESTLGKGSTFWVEIPLAEIT